MRLSHCASCNKPLTGKQRRYCSDRCRKRVKRESDNGPRLSAIGPEMAANKLNLSSNGRELSANRVVTILIAAKYEDNGFTAEWDGSTLQIDIRKEVAAYIQKKLSEAYPRWDFELLLVEAKGIVGKAPWKDAE